MKKLIRSKYALASVGVLTAMLTPIITLAQQVPAGTGGVSVSGTTAGATAACQSIIDSASVGQANGVLASIAVFLAGTPFRVAAVIGFIVGAIVLLMDGGHLPHVVQKILQVLMIVVIAGILVGYVFGGSNMVQC